MGHRRRIYHLMQQHAQFYHWLGEPRTLWWRSLEWSGLSHSDSAAIENRGGMSYFQRSHSYSSREDTSYTDECWSSSAMGMRWLFTHEE